MPLPKAPEPGSGKAAAPAIAGERKPWVKKTPVQVVLEQADKLKVEIIEDEKALEAKRKQLKKFEEAKKIFETT